MFCFNKKHVKKSIHTKYKKELKKVILKIDNCQSG